MRRLLIALGAFFGLGLAAGLVLPFDGPGGGALALALADRVEAPSPVLAELTLPETPWPQGWGYLVGTLYGPGGARLAYEATGADWVLVGRVQPDGWIEAYLYGAGGLERARFSEPELLAAWLALKVEAPRRPLVLRPQLDGALARLRDGDVEGATRGLAELDPQARARLEAEIAAVKGLFAHGADLAALGLPAAVADYWAHRQDPEAMGDAGMGPVWKAFFPITQDDRPAARERALALLGSDRALDLAGALLLLRALDDPAWVQAARRLTAAAPELTLGWEELSFAAFDANDADEAASALERALTLDPENDLYWTNLGWARYLQGDLPGAIAASLRAMRLAPNPTAAYNLGLFYALARDHDRAFAHYLQALRLDDEGVASMALEDLAKTHRTDLLYWQGFLLERTGRAEEARQAYAGFLAEHPDHPLAPLAREALAALERVETRLELLGFRLGPLDVGFEVGTGEAVRPRLRAETSGYLPSGPVEVEVRSEAGVVAHARDEVTLPPLTSDWTRELAPVTVAEPGRYRVTVRYAGRSVEAELRVRPGHLARRLLAQEVVPLGLGGTPLLTPEELAAPDGTDRLVAALLEAVRAAAPNAERVERFAKPLPAGPFQGRSVAQLMATADAKLVRRFLEAALERPQLLLEQDAVNAFAAWLAELR